MNIIKKVFWIQQKKKCIQKEKRKKKKELTKQFYNIGIERFLGIYSLVVYSRLIASLPTVVR